MEPQQLQVEYEGTESLVPYARNAKEHTAEQVEQIAKSIEEFGFNDPVAVWTNAEGDSEIVEGHGRVLAAKKLGMERVPVMHLDRMTDEQRRAYTHVHNQLTMNTGWDFETLDLDIEELSGLGFRMGEFGFDGGIEFNTLDELMNEDFVTVNDDRETFSVTFEFPLDEEDSIKGYIASCGKEQIVACIVEQAASWE